MSTCCHHTQGLVLSCRLGSTLGQLVYPCPEDTGAPVPGGWRERHRGWLSWEVRGERRSDEKGQGVPKKWGLKVSPAEIGS